MTLDEHTIYAFVRTDFDLVDQMLDFGHAVERLAILTAYSSDGIPNMVLIGLPHEKSMKRALRYIESLGLAHFDWKDPDKGDELRAVAVGPVGPELKHLLTKYVLYRPPSVLVTGSFPPSTKTMCSADIGAVYERPSDAAVAQLDRAPQSTGEVDGSIPSSGSTSESTKLPSATGSA